MDCVNCRKHFVARSRGKDEGISDYCAITGEENPKECPKDKEKK